ncbi:hypothetical protein NEOC84_001259|nr:hypothetical protein [Neochlamydia sp. AcF84]
MERLDQGTASLESKKGANRYLKNEKKQASSLGLDLEKLMKISNGMDFMEFRFQSRV